MLDLAITSFRVIVKALATSISWLGVAPASHQRRAQAAFCMAMALLLWTGCLIPAEDSYEDEPTTSVAEAASPLMASNGLTINGLTINGLTIHTLTIDELAVNRTPIDGIHLDDLELGGTPLTGQQISNAEILMKYLIECALPADDSAVLYRDDQPSTYAGQMGLAPAWKTGGLSLVDERKVSACIAARANPVGEHIVISIRHFEIETTATEQLRYTVHEGAFWGNFFGSSPVVYACHVQGGGDSSRTCTESPECGFNLMGSCASACASYDNVNGYYRCSGGGADEVINSFLETLSSISQSPSQARHKARPHDQRTGLLSWQAH